MKNPINKDADIIDKNSDINIINKQGIYIYI